MARAADKYILYKITGIKTSTLPVTMLMREDLAALMAVLTDGIMMITDTEVGLAKVAARVMAVVTDMVGINESWPPKQTCSFIWAAA